MHRLCARFGWGWILVLALVRVASLTAVEKPPELPDFSSAALFPPIEAAVTQAGEPAKSVVLAPAGTARQRGDVATFLVLAEENKTMRQWAVTLATGEVGEKERHLLSPPAVFYLSTGQKLKFSPQPLVAVAIHVMGPYSEKKGAAGAKDVRSGTLVSPQFLEIGLEQAAGLVQRINEQLKDHVTPGERFGLSINSSPFPPEELARQRPWVERAAITDAEARAFGGFVPALISFFQVAAQTPGLREIVFEAIDVPWWSIAANGGKVDQISFRLLGPPEPLPPTDWSLPVTAKVYALNLILLLQGKPALHCRLAVTEPRVPLVNSAGIIGAAVMRPNGKGPHITVRLLGARPAAAGAN